MNRTKLKIATPYGNIGHTRLFTNVSRTTTTVDDTELGYMIELSEFFGTGYEVNDGRVSRIVHGETGAVIHEFK
jgi:hypothetical protein